MRDNGRWAVWAAVCWMGVSFAYGAEVGDWRELAERFDVQARETGYLKSEELLALLDRAVSAAAPVAPAGLGAAGLLLIVIGGLALNLTPCVLPMIPVNLAIIGAGARAQSRARGFLLGGLYGLGMTLAYGALGLFVLLTGRTFGVLNASPWFNAAMAALFLVMTLALFDVVRIDLSRFQRAGPGGARGTGGLAFGMGVVAALLAGACVAPVVISVLALAGTQYAAGNWTGLWLPFLLGAGMALPWPFAGAGLSFLPKPGAWMKWVKIVFGVAILGFAVYYGRLAHGQFAARAKRVERESAATGPAADPEITRLAEGLRRGLAEGKPVFVDFWATWCKNCLAMERTTFKDPEVIRRLDGMVVVKFQAEDPDAPATKAALERYQVIGLPTYLLLAPRR